MRVIVRGAFAAVVLLAGIGTGEPAFAQHSFRIEGPTVALVTREQIAESKPQSAWHAVEQLHSNWLVERLPKPTDRNASGPAGQPASTCTTEVNGAGKTAPGRFGLGHSSGVIFVTSLAPQSKAKK